MRADKTSFAEFLCGKHWAMTPKRWRRVLHRIHKRMRRYGRDPVIDRVEARIWDRLKRVAIERAMGIG